MDNKDVRWILVADDDDDIREMIRDCIQSQADGLNLQVIEAKDGQEAILNANARAFHCVVTDLTMPRATGTDFLRAIQTNPLNANTPTVVVTGAETSEFTERFSHIRVVQKPFNPTELAQIVVREVKLGRLDERATIQFMNPFLASLQKFLEQESQLASQLQPPLVKKRGEELSGDYHCNLTITSGLARYFFCLSFDKQLTEYIKSTFSKKRTSQWHIYPPDTVLKQACKVIFDLATKQIEGILGLPPRVASLDVSLPTATPNFHKELAQMSGATIAVKTEHGSAYASALVKPKSKKI